MLFLSTLLATIPLISAHGIVISPPPRAPGPSSLAACGKEITSIIKHDNQTSINSLQVASASSSSYNPQKCNLLVCKGLQLSDNLDNVQEWKPGQVVELKVWTRIPHRGWASAAIVDTGSMMIVGEQLGSWETGSVSGYEVQDLEEDEHGQVRGEMAVDLEFNVTIPKIFPRCAVAGECVLQWTWFGRVVKQTYESCVDFTIASESFLREKEDLDSGNGGSSAQKKIPEKFLG